MLDSYEESYGFTLSMTKYDNIGRFQITYLINQFFEEQRSIMLKHKLVSNKLYFLYVKPGVELNLLYHLAKPVLAIFIIDNSLYIVPSSNDVIL